MMIQPEGIRRKAKNLYPSWLRSWLVGDESFFPRPIPACLKPSPNDLSLARKAVLLLRESSKEVRGFGYTIDWCERASRTFGRNSFPERISFESREDYLRFIGKEEEFTLFAAAVIRLRSEFPELEGWMRSHPQVLLKAAPDVEGLLHVVRYLREHPRPNLFARELPIPVDTKFIERHESLLREWLDRVLPKAAIEEKENHFERRYGLRYAEPDLRVRLLAPELAQELRSPWLEFSLPLGALAELPVRAAAVIVVENKVNLLTLPPLPRGVGLGALGANVVLLRYLPWLNNSRIVYWGDIDVEGLEILSSLRAIFPQTRSILMDAPTLSRWQHLTTTGTGHRRNPPPHLEEPERAAYIRCREGNLRLEQERIPQEEVLAVLTANEAALKTPCGSV